MHDFRSDTVTKPTAAMLAAISRDGLGDDVLGEDQTTNELEEYAAKLAGFEAGLFVASGTMGNLIAVLAHCPRGSQFLVGHKAHILYYEAGGTAMVGGILPRSFPITEHGTAELRDIEALIQPADVHYAPTRLICLENTYNGYPLTAAYTADVAALAKRHGLKLHIDGARICNGAVAENTTVAELVKGADSLNICLSKGLGAPVGSVLLGSREFIEKARHLRKTLGGGWRQSGVLAAMGLKALKHSPGRLHEDHTLAYKTAEQLCLNPGLRVDLTHVKTNMVFAALKKGDPAELVTFMKARGIAVYHGNPVRLVFHQDVGQDAASALVAAFTDFFASKP